MRILVAVPTFETIFPETFKAIYDLDTCGNEVSFEYIRGYDCAVARNKIAKKAIELEADKVLMVDSDTVIPKDALTNLLSHGKEVVLGYYAHRVKNGPYDGRSNVCRLGPVDYVDQYQMDDLKALALEGTYLERVHGGGMGCALISTDIFKRTDYPWFDWVKYKNGLFLSEDLFFCEVCRKNGIPIYVDPRVSCGHIFRSIQE